MIRAPRRVLTGNLSFAIRVCVNCSSSTIFGQGTGTMAGDEILMNRRKNSRKVKDIPKDVLGIVRKLLTGKNLIYYFPRRVFCRFLFNQFPIGFSAFLSLAGISAGKRKCIVAILKEIENVTKSRGKT